MGSHQPIEWSDALLTGVAEIDAQHRFLVDTLIAADAAPVGEGGGRQAEKITRDLLAYAIYHFETEEALLRRSGYDRAEPADADLHRQQHRGFSQRVVELRAEVRDSERSAQEALVSFLKDWLINHILTSDRRLGQFIVAQGGRADADPT